LLKCSILRNWKGKGNLEKFLILLPIFQIFQYLSQWNVEVWSLKRKEKKAKKSKKKKKKRIRTRICDEESLASESTSGVELSTDEDIYGNDPSLTDFQTSEVETEDDDHASKDDEEDDTDEEETQGEEDGEVQIIEESESEDNFQETDDADMDSEYNFENDQFETGESTKENTTDVQKKDYDQMGTQEELDYAKKNKQEMDRQIFFKNVNIWKKNYAALVERYFDMFFYEFFQFFVETSSLILYIATQSRVSEWQQRSSIIYELSIYLTCAT
jgi:hypothetical protein